VSVKAKSPERTPGLMNPPGECRHGLLHRGETALSSRRPGRTRSLRQVPGERRPRVVSVGLETPAADREGPDPGHLAAYHRASAGALTVAAGDHQAAVRQHAAPPTNAVPCVGWDRPGYQDPSAGHSAQPALGRCAVQPAMPGGVLGELRAYRLMTGREGVTSAWRRHLVAGCRTAGSIDRVRSADSLPWVPRWRATRGREARAG